MGTRRVSERGLVWLIVLAGGVAFWAGIIWLLLRTVHAR